MKEVTGNLWTTPADIKCITTNGDTNARGEAVMGRGCAREAKDRYPGLARHFARRLAQHGNVVQRLTTILTDGRWEFDLLSFPVKHHWHEAADLPLIERSARDLVAYVDLWTLRRERSPFVLLPRPGCGNGQLTWDEVRPVIEPLLDDRFTIITF